MIDEEQELPEAEELDSDLPEDFDIIEDEDGNGTVIPKESNDLKPEQDADFYDNLAESIDSYKLSQIASEYLELIEVDKDSRKKRDDQYAEAIRRSGLGDDAPGGADFEGASRVVHPMISEAAIDFAATAIKEIFPAAGPVRMKIEGKVTPEKLQKADRKTRHMNWQMRTQIKELKPSLEQILTQVPMGGVQYSKMYYDPRSRRAKFEFIPLDDIYVPFHAANFYSATRKTHRQRLNQIEFENRVSSGLYIDPEYWVTDPSVLQDESKSEKASNKVEGKTNPLYDEDGLRTVYEVYCWLEIEEDTLSSKEYKYAPYIITIDYPTEKILAVYRNWDPQENTYDMLDWIVEWQFIPWRGAYAIGLHHLIGGLSTAATGALRALLDSAHINNSPSAIKLKGGQFSGQSIQVAPTQISEIDAAPGVDDIRKIAMPLPFNAPSPVLFQLLGFLVDSAKGVVRTVIEHDPNFSPNMAPGTQMNWINEGLKVYSGIHGRMHDSMDKCLSILHRLNKNYLEEEAPSEEDDEESTSMVDEKNDSLAYRSDYEGELDVQPVSDPNIFSDSQRIAQMSSIGALIDKYPDVGYDRRAYNKCMLELLKVPNIDQILPDPPGMKDENPVTENIKMATGAPAGVLPDQDHLAHIQVHMDFYMSQLGQNPAIKPSLAPAFVSHMSQHILMLYGSEVKDLIEKASKAKIKDLISDDKDVMLALSKAAAAASPMAIENATALLEKVMPAVAEAMQFAKQMTPQPQDPIAVQAQIEGAKLQQQGQIEGAKIQQRSQEIEKKAEIEQMKEQSDLQEAQMRASVELEKNEEDNQTALTIAGMRTLEGQTPGNLKNGNSLDQNF